MKMRFLSLILVITMLTSIVPTVSLASNSQGEQNVQSDGAYVPTSESAELSSTDAEVAESWGMLGDNIMWEIEGATLYIDGAGDMPDYEFGNVSPWIYDEETFPYEFHNVVIGDEITSIDDTVFYLCDNIVEITIGKSVERIEDGAFAFCEMLESIVVSEENPAYMSDENGILFNKLGNTLVQYPNELILDSFNRDYEIPDGVGTVGPYAFRGSNLKTVTFSDTVCEIGHDAFEGCTSLTDIEIPDSLTEIEDRVFCGCSSLQKIVIPDGVEEIRSQAFAAMRLYEITIPASVKVIEADAFDSSCDENTNVYYGGSESDWNNIQIVSGGNEMLMDVTVKHFAKTDSEDEVPDVVAGVLTEGECGDDLTWTLSADGTLNIDGTGDMELWSSDVYTPWHESKDSISTVVLSDGVTNIGAYAFENCTNLTDIEIPDGVSSIGDSAFSACTSLASVAIPEGVEDIGLCAFSGCKSLGSVNIPSTVSLIYDRAFYGCSSLSKITVSDENEFFSSDENGVLFNKIKSTLICCPGGTAMTAYEIPDGVTQLDTQAFSGCASLTDVIIPEGVTDLPKGLFEDCVSLSSVTVPSTVKAIDDECFGGCDSLSQIYYCGTEEEWNEVSVSDTNEALGDVSIEYEIPMVASGACGDGISWTLDTVGMLTISGSGAMTEWSASSALPWYDYSADIKNIVIEDGVTTVGSYAFCGLSSLRSISIPDSVTKIGNSTFNGCILLKSVYIPKNVATIGWSAFYGCASLKTVTLYDTITTIGASAFNKCSVLSDIYYYGNAEQWAAVTVNSNNVPLTAAAKHYIV
ncbi:MAG: leucine-rich repeat domain-containing protein, partial [Clostridia bacterium]|nr:leucine-rich repeat domain-containing protein [Clostridia bacterium]